jgi:hypothetical protein
MSEYDYYETDPSKYNYTSLDNDFIGGKSLIILSIVFFAVVVLIVLAIYLFSKKLNNLEYEESSEQCNNPIEEMEPLPEYEEREIHPDGEVDLTDYIQENNTINTIPRDTMAIINILSRNSQRNIHINDTNTHNNGLTRDNNVDGNQINETELNGMISIPSTSTLPLPTTERENIPSIPPPCYDIALTQPRINKQGMIVLPQDPSFTENLPTQLRNSSSHHHALRKGRRYIKRFFTIHGTSSSSNNNYRFSNQSSSLHSFSSYLTNNTFNSNMNSNLNSFSPQYSNDNNDNIDNNENNNNSSDIRPLDINRSSGSDGSRSRSILDHLHPSHSSSISSRRKRRNFLRRHNALDNASISSVSIYPTTTIIDVPEDHYNISGISFHEVRNTNIPQIERGCSSTTTVIPGINDVSITVQSISSEDNVNSTSSNVDTNNIDTQATQTNSLEVLNSAETWIDVAQSNPSLSNNNSMIIDLNSVNNNNNNNLNQFSNNNHSSSIQSN